MALEERITEPEKISLFGVLEEAGAIYKASRESDSIPYPVSESNSIDEWNSKSCSDINSSLSSVKDLLERLSGTFLSQELREARNAICWSIYRRLFTYLRGSEFLSAHRNGSDLRRLYERFILPRSNNRDEVIRLADRCALMFDAFFNPDLGRFGKKIPMDEDSFRRALVVAHKIAD